MKEKKTDEQAIQKIEKTSADIGPEQLKSRPGIEHDMDTSPVFDDGFPGAARLQGKVALITGADSGIGRAVALAFAKEGARLALVYLRESVDARDTQDMIEQSGGDVIRIEGDIGDKAFCTRAVHQVIKTYGQLDILINNAAEQHPQKDILDISPKQLERTFRTNIFGIFYMVQAALPHLKQYSSIINTTSVTAYAGSAGLLDYSASKGAITTFTRSLAENLATRKIRVNQVAPGPIWTPLIPSTFDKEHVDSFGKDTLMQRAGQPIELVEAYIFLAWNRASSYVTGQTLHVNGGKYMSD